MWPETLEDVPDASVALVEGEGPPLQALRLRLAERPGAIIPVFAATPAAIVAQPDLWPLDWLAEEVAISVNTAAAGGDPGLLALDGGA